MTIHDPNWKTATAAESRVPGYLARRFAKIRREQKAEADAAAEKLIEAEEAQKKADAEADEKVTPMARGRG